MISPLKLGDTPFPLWLALLPAKTAMHQLPFDPLSLAESILGDTIKWICSEFRAVSIERLPTVVRVGLDKEPTTMGIYADAFEKAWEYGEFPKLMLVLDGEQTEPSFREVRADLPADELAVFQSLYRTMLRSMDGTQLWFSQFPADDPRVSSSYEIAHGRYVPGDPFDALRAVLIFVRPEDIGTLESRIATQSSEFPSEFPTEPLLERIRTLVNQE